MKIQGRARLRKCAVVFESLERTLLTGAPASPGVPLGADACRYAVELASSLATMPDCPKQIVAAAKRLAATEIPAIPAAGCEPREFVRALDSLRHLCMRESGQTPADWDLIAPRSAGSGNAVAEKAASGNKVGGSAAAENGKTLRAYLEDIRSPFNVGSIFRSAEAFGFQELILSPECADPGHPRAARSAMGAIDMVSWRRAPLGDIADKGPFFALELGGEPLDDFDFPRSGTVIVGSEELGVSENALAACGLGKVSIPMRGAKASLNVAVAFGILAQRWKSI